MADKSNSTIDEAKKIYTTDSLEAKKQLAKSHLFLQEFCNNIAKINETSFYKTFFGECKNDSKRTWDGIRSFINVKENSTRSKQIKSAKTIEKTESSPKILADLCNKFSVTIAENIDKKLFIQMQIRRSSWKIQ